MEDTTLRLYSTEVLRATDADGDTPARISGLAVPFDALSENLGGFRELVKPGAFDESMKDDIIVDVMHDRAQTLARTSKGTARIVKRENGLYVEIDVPDSTAGRDALANVRNGNLDGMSVAFSKNPTIKWSGRRDNIVREIHKGKLRAVTLTNIPAYRQTAGSVAEGELQEYREGLETTDNADNDTKPEPQTPTSVLRAKCDAAELT